MAYTTQASLEERVGEAELVRLTDDANTGTVNTDVLDRIVAEGEAELLGYLGQRYTLPLALGNAIDAAVVRAHCADVIVYRLYIHRDREATADLLSLYKAAVEWAKAIAAGSIGLLAETPVTSSPATGGKIIVSSEEAVITRDSMQGL